MLKKITYLKIIEYYRLIFQLNGNFDKNISTFENSFKHL